MQTGDRAIIADQDKKIRRYEQKMRDLIEAYKTQTKEKEALECTLKSLLSSKDQQCQPHEQSNVNDVSELATANKQVIMLSNAIATLTDEKRKLERNYLDDKRATRTEHENIVAILRRELDTQTALVDKLEDRCAAQADAVMSAEAQVACLREETERVRQKHAEIELQEQQAVRAAYEARVALLEEAVATLASQHEYDTKDELQQLDQQQQQQQALHIQPENRRFRHPDCQCQCSTPGDQTRTVGQRDTPDILQFDYEVDKTLRRSSASASEIVDQMRLLRSQLAQLDPELDLATLLLASDGSQCCDDDKQPGDSGAGQSDGKVATDTDPDGGSVQETTPRTPGQTLFMSVSVGKGDEETTERRMQRELDASRARLDELQEQLASADTVWAGRLTKMRDTLAKTEWAHKQELGKLQQSSNQTVLDLQSELARHRNRTIALLADKEAEIVSLKKLVQHDRRGSQETLSQQYHQISDDEQDQHELLGDSLLDQHRGGSAGGGGTGGGLSSCPLYQCCEMKARMNQELKTLRQTRRQLLAQLHQLEASTEYLRSDWRAEVGVLTARAERAESINKMASGVNMEYLRNVLLRYMGSADPSCRFLMAKAIGKVLQFSSDELASLTKHS